MFILAGMKIKRGDIHGLVTYNWLDKEKYEFNFIQIIFLHQTNCNDI